MHLCFLSLTFFVVVSLSNVVLEQTRDTLPRYKIEIIKSPSAVFAGIAFATAINNKGRVAGSIYLRGIDGSVPVRAFVWEKGETALLPALGGQYSSAYSINDQGDVAGGAVKAERTGYRFEDETHVYVPVVWIGMPLLEDMSVYVPLALSTKPDKRRPSATNEKWLARKIVCL